MSLLAHYPKGSDITILNASYHRRQKDQDTGKWNSDFMVISYKDNVNQTKGHEIIYEPSYVYYKAKDNVPIRHNMFYIEKDKVNPVECKYTDLAKSIAEETGNLDFYYDNIKAGNFSGNKALHTIPSIFSSDANIEDHWRARFAREYVNEEVPVTKGYFDIEADTKRMQGDFPELGECPINAVSYIDDKTNTVNVFLLRDIFGDNPFIEEFEKNNFSDINKASSLFKELQEFIIINVGGPEKAKKFGVDHLNFEFMFFDDEVQLLITLFQVINKNSPDFMLAWNMAFDIPYIIERCYVLGIDPALVLSDSRYTEKYATYYIDNLHKNEYELRGDYYDIAADTVYLDQLVQFASRRKGQAAFPNFKLDTAADIITKGAVRKLDYSHITTNISELPYKDYKTFVFYNIMDTIAQKCIEVTVEDIDYIFATCVTNDTRYSKGHRQTVYLTNRTRKYFYGMGYILGNNCNTGEKTPFPGAMVGDPTHNSNYAKKRSIIGEIFNIVDNCDDFDFKSLYPSIDRECNLAPNTIIGKIIIDNKVHKWENPYHNKDYDRGGQFMEDLVTGNPLEFCKRWFGFADFREILEDINEYFSMHIPIRNQQVYTKDGMFIPFITRPNAPKDVMIKPFGYLEDDEMMKPFQIYDDSKIPYISNILNEHIS